MAEGSAVFLGPVYYVFASEGADHWTGDSEFEGFAGGVLLDGSVVEFRAAC